MAIYKGQFPINFTGGAFKGGQTVSQIYRGGNIVYGEIISTVDQDVVNFIARVTANGGSLSATEESAIATLVSDLKTYNIWNDCQAIYPCVGGSAASTKVNLRNTGSFELSFSGTVTYSSDGFKTDGSSGYADTFWSASITTGGQNDIHVGIMLFENQSQNGIALGSDDGNPALNIYPRYNGSQVYGRINSAADGPTTTVASSKHLYLLRRIQSNESSMYIDGTEYNLATNSTGEASGNVYIGRNSVGGAQYFPAATCFVTLGDGLTDTQMTDYTTAIQAFQTTLGGNRPY